MKDAFYNIQQPNIDRKELGVKMTIRNNNKNVNSNDTKPRKKVKDLLDMPVQEEEKKQPSISTEYKYGLLVRNDENIKKLNTESDSKVFVWARNHWKLLSEQEGKTMAFNWLSGSHKHLATAKMASSCHQTLKLVVGNMPKETNDTIIPLQNKWLRVNDSNEFEVIEPNKQLNIKYVINTNIKTSDVQKTYKPLSVPADSKFMTYLNTALPKKDIQQLVQEYCGYTLLNDNRFQKAMVMEGEGANGKSVLLEIMRSLHQNTRSIRIDNMANFGLTPLLDASLVISAETPKKKIHENELKSAISGDLMTIESKNKDLISHKPKAKWLIACNTFPHIDDKTDGVLRRLIIVPFERTFQAHEQIKNLDQILINEELHHILNWCLEGLQRLLKRGDFLIPDEIAKVKKTKQEESDHVRRFTREYGFAYDNEKLMSKQEIYDEYRDYTEQEGSPSCSQEEFWKRMKRVFPRMEESRKVLPGQGKRQHRMVNLKTGCYDNPTPPTKRTPELEAMFKEWLEEELAKQEAEVAPQPENAPEAVLEPLEATNEPEPEMDFDPKLLWGLSQKIKVNTAVKEEVALFKTMKNYIDRKTVELLQVIDSEFSTQEQRKQAQQEYIKITTQTINI